MPLSRSSLLLLTYGVFSVLIQLCMILLYIESKVSLLSPSLLCHHYGPWLEYPLASLALTLGGAYFLHWIQKKET